jgi:hypothetical protein
LTVLLLSYYYSTTLLLLADGSLILVSRSKLTGGWDFKVISMAAASPVATVVEDREDEPPRVYAALVGALSRGDAHTVHALLLETGLAAEEGGGSETGMLNNSFDGYQVGSEGACSSAPVLSVLEAVKLVREV